VVFYLLVVTAIGGRPKHEMRFLPGRLRWTLLSKECYGDSLSGRGWYTQPSNQEADRGPSKVRKCGEISFSRTRNIQKHWKSRKQGEAVWIKCVLCSYYDKILNLF